MDKCIKILGFIFSLIALAISAYAVSNQYYADIPTTVLTLVGICATLIVGTAVIDTFAVHSVLHKMEEKMEKQESKLAELEKLQEDIIRMKRQTNILFHHTWGLASADKHPYGALNEFWKAFCLAARDDDIERAKSCLENAEEVAKNIMQRKKEQQEIDISYSDIKDLSYPEELKKSKVYIAFGERIDKLMSFIREMKG